MKKILLIILFISLINKTSAQEYTPMFEIGKIWNMHHYNWLFPNSNHNFNITIENIITINEIEYYEASNGDIFREDITTKKVYELINGVEELILDFDLEIGDDLISPLITIDEVFSKQISEIGVNTFYGIPNLKYYQTKCGEMIIEGIGIASVGLFFYSTLCAPLDYKEGDFLINMNQPLVINDYFIQNNINLYYNEIDGNLELTNTSNNVAIDIYSVLGKKIISKQIDNFLNVTQLQKGIYFYRLSKNNAIKKGKISIY